MRGWKLHVPLLILLFAVSYWVRTDAAQHRVSAGHGDVAAYFHVSKNLFAGRGFVQDFIADFLQDPQGVPTPSNTWWLPLPSIIAWGGMELAGEPTFVAAKQAMIAVASLVPLVCYLTGLLLIGTLAGAIGSGLLGMGFHLYLDQPTVTLSHGPYSVFASAALLCVIAYPRYPRVLSWFGLCFGLTYLCRGDSQILVVSMALTVAVMSFLAKERLPIPWKGIVGAVGLFLLVVAPWWARNQQVLGEKMPSGVKKVVWAKSYEEWFSDPSHLTAGEYFNWGWDNILEQKRDGVVDALEYTPGVMLRSVVREREEPAIERNPGDPKYRLWWLAKFVLTPLFGLGTLWLCFRWRWVAAIVLLHVLMLVAVYGVVFPGVGRESYRSSLFSIFPIALASMVAIFHCVATPFRRSHPKVYGAIVIGLAALLGWQNVEAVRPHLKEKANGVEGMLASYRHLGQWWKNRAGPDAVFFVRNPWEFTAETGLRSVMIPQVSGDRMLEYARQFNVAFLLDEQTQGMKLRDLRPGAAALIERGLAIEIPNAPIFKLYRIIPPPTDSPPK